MRGKIIVIAASGLTGEVFELAVFLDLDKFRLFSKLINRKLRNNRPEPSGERTASRVIRELALFVAVRVLP